MSSDSGRFCKTILAPAVLFLLLAFSGCGYKDKPVPPYRLIPTPVIDLRYQLGEKGATLSWSYPVQTVSGDELSEIGGFELYRAEVAADSYCKTCPIPFTEPIALPGGVLPPERTKTASYEATLLRPGYLYFFKLRSKNGWWIESRDSNVVSFLWHIPPMAPAELIAVSGDQKNTLKWHPVNRLQDATPMTAPVRYQVYRSVGEGVPVPIGAPLSTTSFTDTGVENGKTYSYQVQAINNYDQGAISGAMSATVTAIPVDRTAPPVPQGVEGIRTEVGVKIFWEHVAAGDLAGYRVYRRAAGETKARLAGEVRLPYNLFIDAKAPQKGPLFYTVSSIDTQDPANESGQSAEMKLID